MLTVANHCCHPFVTHTFAEWPGRGYFEALTWPYSVELRGFEPLTPCMPFTARPSADVQICLIQRSNPSVRVRRNPPLRATVGYLIGYPFFDPAGCPERFKLCLLAETVSYAGGPDPCSFAGLGRLHSFERRCSLDTLDP
jgi:hypothetical protein